MHPLECLEMPFRFKTPSEVQNDFFFRASPTKIVETLKSPPSGYKPYFRFPFFGRLELHPSLTLHVESFLVLINENDSKHFFLIGDEFLKAKICHSCKLILTC